MAKLNYRNGFTSIILRVKIRDSSSTTGAAKTGLTSSSSGLIISTIADNEATPTVYAQASSNIETITTLGTFAAPTSGKCRFKEVDATNHPGLYEVQIANARYAVTNARSVVITLSGVANMEQVDAEIQLEPVPADARYVGGTLQTGIDLGDLLRALVPVSGTIGATGNTNTTLHIPGPTWVDNAPDHGLIVLLDVSTGLYYWRWIESYANVGDLVTVAALPYSPEASVDKYWILPLRQDPNSAQIAAIKAKTDGLPSDPADASDIAGAFTTLTLMLRGVMPASGTVGGTGNDTTHVHLSGIGSYANDDINDYTLVLYDASTGLYWSTYIVDFADTGDLAQVPTLSFTPTSGDTWYLLPIKHSSGGTGLTAAETRAAIGLTTNNLEALIGAVAPAVWTEDDRYLSGVIGSFDALVLSVPDAQTTIQDAMTAQGYTSAKAAYIDASIAGVSTAISDVGDTLATVATDLSGLATTVDSVYSGVAGVSTAVAGVSTAVAGVNTAVGNVNTAVGNANTTLGTVNTKVGEMHTTIQTNLDAKVSESGEAFPLDEESLLSFQTFFSSNTGDRTITDLTTPKTLIITRP